MKNTTHYDVLRVTRDAPPEVIRAAYKALSQTWHPDRNPSPDASAAMQALNAAYAVLSDPARRADYDQALRGMSARWAGFRADPQATDDHASSATAAPPQGRRGQAFEIDWEAVGRIQREEDRRYRVFGRDSLIAAAKTFGLLFGAVYLLSLLTSHG
ncbi:J domain-containing protein [Burkholderia pseudomallei]|uniref:J domain-containing protein n=1 Tax=Burkholderia pseudomallei TaxID=28450 RepID=UPI0011079D3F|nr:J domain-containing protein [Burkholderia pseudomallei]MBO2974554.1 DnaJ domain-containing protein [Burkholderia pseudomallei]MBO7755629.1 DnaJ domain-containing protein [Burkholderia pseudomallei]MBO7820523.1 DnaJ domain-containing protein [Burkholderia pseudomallei]MBO7856406.1 DnaJ domain-containing protein [Burkholderia pseudomallei]MBO7886418.1 DnaJ domain-containing protein [Burkholderia pseudomallei]